MAGHLLILVALLAYANGSNDNSKGVATLVGYGAAGPRKALIYATVMTAVGGMFSFWFSGALIKGFSTGLFSNGLIELNASFFTAVLIGAFAWVIIATYAGLPVSTTHAIIGALIGAGLVAVGWQKIQWAVLGRTFVLPLILSPLFSLSVVYLLAWPVVWAVRRATSKSIAIEHWVINEALIPQSGGLQLLTRESESIETVDRVSPAANVIHWISGGLIGFARGWNDTPKIMALSLLALPKTHSWIGAAIAIAAMAAGGLISGKKVLITLSRKLTPLPLPESLTGSLTTAALVCLASWKGLPVSTTHVSTGAIIGAGLKNDAQSVKWKKVTEIILSWIITIPAAALVAAIAKSILR
jgi:PiT family inorganic phosphate transporter